MSDGFRMIDEFSPEQAELMMKRYEKKLSDLGYSPSPYADIEELVGSNIYGKGKFEVLNHALWMCTQIEGFIRQNRMAKAYRWIGMVQGLLFMGGVYTIAELKRHNAEGIE